MKTSLLSAALLIVTGTAIAADLTITSTMTRDGGAPQTATSYLTSDHLRMARPEGDAIIDLRSGDMTVLDAQKKTYYVITKKDIDDSAAMLQERMNSPEMQRAQEQMKNLPPEVQKRMQAAMGGMLNVEVRKSGTSRTIAGYKCDDWSMTIGEVSKSVQCLTTDLKLPMQAWDVYRKYADSLKTMMQAMGPMAKNIDAMREQMSKMKGFPLASTSTTTIMGRTSTTTNEVTSIKEGPVPSSAWTIPSDYTKVDSPMKRMMDRSK